MPTPLVEANEVFYRQVGPGGNPIYYDPAQERPVHQSVFLPTRSDTDGLSLIRSRFRTAVWSAYRIEQPSVRYRLAVLHTTAICKLATSLDLSELTFQPSPDGLDSLHGEPWAHCAVTDINRTDYDTSRDAKRRIKEWAMSLARLVTSDDVLGPFAAPTEADPYRPADLPR